MTTAATTINKNTSNGRQIASSLVKTAANALYCQKTLSNAKIAPFATIPNGLTQKSLEIPGNPSEEKS